jgi:redox-sensitive bicupin YhaK (pirin superfamily)
MNVEDTAKTESQVRLLIEPVVKDLGEFVVRRTLPAPERQRVGPFIFFDHMGPVDFAPGSGVAVRAHPHIGLATITYLFAGQIMHRDSLGNAQVIEKGAINWMTAGQGIVHSERSPEELKRSGSHLHGIQAWVALPVELEETEPRFEHYPAEDVPETTLEGANLRLIVGQAYEMSSPVRASSETFYVEASLDADADLALPGDVEELAVYVVDGEVTVDDCLIAPGTMAVINPGSDAIVHAQTASKLMLLGGATLPGERYLWWNFVSSSQERMQQAKSDWREKRFADVPGETEFIPLPKI